jgi:hypothetical protein
MALNTRKKHADKRIRSRLLWFQQIAPARPQVPSEIIWRASDSLSQYWYGMLFKTTELAWDRDQTERNEQAAGDATSKVPAGKDEARSRRIRVDE